MAGAGDDPPSAPVLFACRRFARGGLSFDTAYG